MDTTNKLVLIGNGFDLAHGLKTSYKNFLDWYISAAFKAYLNSEQNTLPFNIYDDCLIKMNRKHAPVSVNPKEEIVTVEQVISKFTRNEYQSIIYRSPFFGLLIENFKNGRWIDIEREYFKTLKLCFSNTHSQFNETYVPRLNKEFDFIINKLTEYIEIVNKGIGTIGNLDLSKKAEKLCKVFSHTSTDLKIKFLNFNYTETLLIQGYANEEDIIHIHGRASDTNANPIIFGYGDETDPIYQTIEDSGENIYLEHIKSFGYLRTRNYQDLISYIDSAPYTVHIVGHSCGLSDRVLLSEIFEHDNCQKIEIFYHQRENKTDNFKEITQEISRHFKPSNKGLMRRRIERKNNYNYIPQN